MASPSSFYHYQGADGVEVIVQRLEDVPIKYRAQAKKLDLSQEAVPKKLPSELPVAPPAGLAPGQESLMGLHWPSFALGAVISLVAGMAFFVLLRRRSRLVSMLVGLLAMLAFAVGYLTFLRHQVGLRSRGLATPATIIDDARAAASTAQKHYEQQEKTLDQINNMR